MRQVYQGLRELASRAKTWSNMIGLNLRCLTMVKGALKARSGLRGQSGQIRISVDIYLAAGEINDVERCAIA